MLLPLCHRSAVIHLFGIRSPHEDSKWRCVPMVAECQVTRRFLSLDASESRESSGQTRPTRGHRCGAADHTTARRSHTDRGSVRRTQSADVDECANGVPRLARRICSGVWPVRLRTTFTKWDASENPARRPISAVVTRSNSGD